jgi:microcin C transport system substrate-binding protein
MKAVRKFLITVMCLYACVPAVVLAANVTTSYGLTLFGKLKYGPDFKHFDYVNPDAPKGGTFTYGWGNTFDTLNPFIAIGVPPAFQTFDAIIYDHLMVRSGDEPASVYGLVAKSITYPDDYSWAEFHLRDNARWHDGTPVTVDDVTFSLHILKTQAAPRYRTAYAGVAKVEQTGPDSVRFTFSEKNNRGLMYTVAQLPVLPKHFWQTREFNQPTVEPPLTSGPYKVIKVEAGSSYTLQRVADYWGKDLPVNKGRYNFDFIKHDYYRDTSVNFEAFMAGKTDLRWETLPNQWATGYNVPALKDGRLIKKMLKFSGPTLYAGFYFNQRLDKFKDPKVREAMSYAFDFEWLNKNIFHGEYIRLRSHFDHSELANRGLPTGKELELLQPYRDQLDPRVFTTEWNPPHTDANPASLRQNLRKAATLLRQAGYTLQNGKLVSRNGKPLQFEILLFDPFFERATASFVNNLKLLGITATMRRVDPGEWTRLMQNFDYEVTQGFTLPMPLSPGAEQRDYWGSAAADQKGSRNWMGIKNPVVDALIDKLIHAPDREAQVAAARALDRVLCWNFYSIPAYYASGFPIAYWNRFGRPEKQPTWLRLVWYSDTWWVDPKKDAALEKAGGKKAK